MTLITTQGAAMVDTCCTHNCDQGRKCPEREASNNVAAFQERANLHRWANTADRMVVDFAAFWFVSRINWWGVLSALIFLASCTASVIVADGLITMAQRADWGAVAQLVGVAK